MRLAVLCAAIATLLLDACGAAPQAAQFTTPIDAPTAPPTNVPATAAPTAAATPTVAHPTAVPSPTPEPPSPTPEPTAEPTTFAAEPTAAPTDVAPPPKADANGGGPVRLVIEAIGLDQPIVSVGLDKNRIPIVPKHDVGWYNLSAGPGQGENVVLWGHVLRFRSAPKIPAPFERLKQLTSGAQVTLYDGEGNPHAYVVTQQVRVTPDQVEYILPRGKEQVTMVSCIGDRVITSGQVVDMSHRLVTIAEPAR